jgi:hypothetical protein
MNDYILRKLPNKFLPRGKKSKSPRNQVCKIDKNGPMVYLVYVKVTNILPISKKDNDGLGKIDYAGVFTSNPDAYQVTDCLNKIFSWYHVYDDKYKFASPYMVERIDGYKVVSGFYQMIGNIGRRKYETERLLAIVTDKTQLSRIKQEIQQSLLADEFIHELKMKSSPNNVSKLHVIPTVHVQRYKINDIMPTMHLDDYSISQNKEHLKAIVNELYTYPHTKNMKQLISAIEYMPITKAMKSGGIQYQNFVNDPEFKKRWNRD